MTRTCKDYTFSFLPVVSSFGYWQNIIYINLKFTYKNFKSIIGTRYTYCICPINFMAGTCKESTFSFLMVLASKAFLTAGSVMTLPKKIAIELGYQTWMAQVAAKGSSYLVLLPIAIRDVRLQVLAWIQGFRSATSCTSHVTNVWATL